MRLAAAWPRLVACRAAALAQSRTDHRHAAAAAHGAGSRRDQTPARRRRQDAARRAPQPIQPTWLPQGTAELQVLDKVNAQNALLTVKVGQEAQFGSLSIQVQACSIRPPDQPRDSAAFLTITDSHRRCAGLPRLDAGEQPVAVDAAASDLRRARRRLPRLTHARAPLPPLSGAALLLDLDGTLLDLAPRPDAVVVPPGLPDTLRALRRLLGDAVAVVTGRPVEMVDALLGDAIFAVAGEHGGAIRHGPGQAVERPPLPSPPGDWLVEAERLALDHPGALLEHKARGFALHYRAVPDARPDAARSAVAPAGRLRPTFELLPAHMLWEVRPRGVDKGKAVAALMDRPPFRGRLPVFIGDDVTDEDGIAAAATLGGAGLRVQDAFGDAAGVRAWLQRSQQWAGRAMRFTGLDHRNP